MASSASVAIILTGAPGAEKSTVAVGSWGGWCLSMAEHVTVTGATDGATAAGGC